MFNIIQAVNLNYFNQNCEENCSPVSYIKHPQS